MKDNFEPTVLFILNEERGFVVDHAGATKMGLTIGLMKALKLDLNRDGVVDVKDVHMVDAELVRKVFRTEFWDRIHGDDLPAGVDLVTADFCYNAGPRAALTIATYNDIEVCTLRRQMYYWTLRQNNPGKYKDDFDGWIGRSLRCWQRALELQAGYKK